MKKCKDSRCIYCGIDKKNYTWKQWQRHLKQDCIGYRARTEGRRAMIAEMKKVLDRFNFIGFINSPNTLLFINSPNTLLLQIYEEFRYGLHRLLNAPVSFKWAVSDKQNDWLVEQYQAGVREKFYAVRRALCTFVPKLNKFHVVNANKLITVIIREARRLIKSAISTKVITPKEKFFKNK